MEAKELTKIVEDAVLALGEHFEAVQIFVSNSEGDGTYVSKQGSGNMYARLGMAAEFLEEEKEDRLAYKIADMMGEVE